MILQLVAALVFIGLVFLCFRSLKDPGIALGLVWSIYAMEQVLQQGNSFFLNHTSFLNILVAGVAGAAAFKNILSQRVRLSSFPMIVAMEVGLFVFAGISVYWAPFPPGSAQVFKAAIPYLITFVLIAPLCASDVRQLEKAVQVLLYFGFLILIGLLFSTTDNRAIVIAQAGGEAVKGNPLAVSTFGGHVLLAAMFNIYSKRPTSLKLMLYLTIAGVAMLAMARSGSRGQIVAVIIAAFIWLPITAKVAAKRSSIIAILAAAAATIALVYVVSNSDYAVRWSRKQVEANTFGRVASATRLVSVYGRSDPGTWVFGLGSSASYQIVGGYPHIVLPEVLAEEGLIGLSLFLGIVVGTLSLGFKWIRSPEIDISSRVYLGLTLAFFTFDFILSFKQGSLLGSTLVFSFAAIIGWFSFSLKRQYTRSRQQRRQQQLVLQPQLRR